MVIADGRHGNGYKAHVSAAEEDVSSARVVVAAEIGRVPVGHIRNEGEVVMPHVSQPLEAVVVLITQAHAVAASEGGLNQFQFFALGHDEHLFGRRYDEPALFGHGRVGADQQARIFQIAVRLENGGESTAYTETIAGWSRGHVAGEGIAVGRQTLVEILKVVGTLDRAGLDATILDGGKDQQGSRHEDTRHRHQVEPTESAGRTVQSSVGTHGVEASGGNRSRIVRAARFRGAGCHGLASSASQAGRGIDRLARRFHGGEHSSQGFQLSSQLRVVGQVLLDLSALVIRQSVEQVA